MADNPTTIVRTINSLAEISADEWNRCANPPSQIYNPFVSHEFLSALERSGSAVLETGWLTQHIIAEQDDRIIGILPGYLKNHSQGEYVFDWGWADAYERAGGHYYPKLQSSIPFTPVTGPRFLIPDDIKDHDRHRVVLARAAAHITDKLQASSLHITFLPEEDWKSIGDDEQWLRRTDTQFHWVNQDFETFGDFLASLSSRKRKNIRKEREAVAARGLTFENLSGKDITAEHWDAFFTFYIDTGSRKWGSPYLRREFFTMIGESMADKILLIMVKRGENYIAGALNFIGGDTLFGRNWGTIEDHDFLHFETCYYQAIEFAISNSLKSVEAGAQGPHKLARGYLPKTTYSLHYLRDPGLAGAVRDYLERERMAVSRDNRILSQHSPFRRNQ